MSILANSKISGAGISGEAKFDTGFVVGGAVAYRFFDNFRGEANRSYSRSDVGKVTGSGGSLEDSGAPPSAEFGDHKRPYTAPCNEAETEEAVSCPRLARREGFDALTSFAKSNPRRPGL